MNHRANHIFSFFHLFVRCVEKKIYQCYKMLFQMTRFAFLRFSACLMFSSALANPWLVITLLCAVPRFQIYGCAHLAISTVPLHNASSDSLTELVASIADSPAEVDIHFRFMIGDRTGTVHLRANQSLDLRRDEIDLPFNVRAYTHSFLGLAPITLIHGVTIWMHG